MGVKLKNLMESLLLTKMDEVIDKLDCCKCEKCRMDIASYALNRLPAKYVATYEGEVYSKLDTLSTQYETDLLNALFQAAKVVSENPHHNLSVDCPHDENTEK
ncbi:late competence development ComFB family protein [Caproiciproducens faecalis]|uniref:Late competence development ComFB family protein n=1 Tax=Caproiciproducens faecalis TaxID=2820301 RepID=A0ABS7DQP6_9FIRM|nr:late competence development ComFB family protein [Caproiciproducens faecalis]MBW7573622.1 late competence development ComFB family protein [Caproiciproducens faecalis]